MGAHNQSDPEGEPGPFGIFVELYPALRRFAAVVADLDVDPDDLVQDALTATLQRHELIEIRQPAAYLRQAIMHAATNHRRRSARFRLLLPRLSRDSASVDSYPSDLAVLDILQPIDRAVIFLADVEGLSGAAIAEELGLTPGAVRKRISRARRQLRLALDPDGTITEISPPSIGRRSSTSVTTETSTKDFAKNEDTS